MNIADHVKNNSDLIEQLESLKKLQSYINDQVGLKEPKTDPYQSPETNQLDGAFSQAQLEYPEVSTNAKNKFDLTDYADLNVLRVNFLPILAKNGLSLSFFTKLDTKEGSRVLHTRLKHISGQWIETRERIIPDKNDDHTYASTLNFKKRHQMMALLGITIKGDRYDDDAEVAMTSSRQSQIKGTAAELKYDPKTESADTLNEHELTELDYELSEYPDIADMICTSYKIRRLSDLPRSKYRHVRDRIVRIKNQRNGIAPEANKVL